MAYKHSVSYTQPWILRNCRNSHYTLHAYEFEHVDLFTSVLIKAGVPGPGYLQPVLCFMLSWILITFIIFFQDSDRTKMLYLVKHGSITGKVRGCVNIQMLYYQKECLVGLLPKTTQWCSFSRIRFVTYN